MPCLFSRSLLLSAFLLTTQASAGVVVQPLFRLYGFSGDVDAPQWSLPSIELGIDLGVEFSRVNAVDLRLIGSQQLGSASSIGYGEPYSFPAEVYTTLDHEDGSVAASGDALLPEYSNIDATIALDRGGSRPRPDLSPLGDGKASLGFSILSPPMVANTIVHQEPAITVEAAALIVTGDLLGRLAGDYDGNGDVYVNDYIVWRDTLGTHVEPGTGADGNGNGYIDGADYSLWRDHFGVSWRPTNGYLAGDFDYNGLVEAADYKVWRDTLRERVAPFTHADADGDGLVGESDYYIWKRRFGAMGQDERSNFAASVPEPSTTLLLAIAIAALPIARLWR